MFDDEQPGLRAWLRRHTDAIIGIAAVLALLLLLVLIGVDRLHLGL